MVTKTITMNVAGSMTPETVKAVEVLESYDIEYETRPMGTVLESEQIAESVQITELSAAAQAAHELADTGTSEIDDNQTVNRSGVM